MSSTSSAVTYTSVYTIRTRKVFGTDEELFRWSFSMKSYGIRIRWTPYGAEPMYLEYIPLEDEHVFPAKEQPLPPIVSRTTESPGCVAELDPEEYEDDESDPEDGPVDYPMEWGDDGDDDDGDSFRDDANDGDKDEEEEEEHLAPATPAVLASISLPPEAEVERLLAMPTPPPLPLTSLPPPSAGYKVRESSTARPIEGQGIDYGFVNIVDAKAR
ncbi:hypothetical protein Tco_0801190 [Tanacetum coccineum]|uniref:Uncharacterized protein n=1 Tax=Tanacetum coccineum TaxID=301880 RepID=A0ABQ4ZYP1_9ASTR